MPIDGYYFCNMACVHDYNSWIVDMVGTDDTMPDDGPGNKDPQQFLMPARPRPNAPIELSPEEQDDDAVPDYQPEEGDAPEQQLEGVCNWSMRTASMQQHTRAHALHAHKNPSPHLATPLPSADKPSDCLWVASGANLLSPPITHNCAPLIARPFPVVPAIGTPDGAAGIADHAAADRAAADRPADADADRNADADRAAAAAASNGDALAPIKDIIARLREGDATPLTGLRVGGIIVQYQHLDGSIVQTKGKGTFLTSKNDVNIESKDVWLVSDSGSLATRKSVDEVASDL